MSNKKLVISNKLKSEEVRRYYDILEKSSESISILFPKHIDYRGFGVIPELLLLFFTWLRNYKGDLIIDIDFNSKSNVKKFIYSYWGYIIVSTAWRHCNIIDKAGESLKSHLKPHTKSFHKAINNLDDKITNETVSITCFDHFSSNQGLSHWFYDSNDNFTATPSGLENSVHLILKAISRIYSKRLTKSLAGSFDSIVRILWELLKNTDEHATQDHLQESRLTPNTRGLFLRIHRSSKANFQKNANHKALIKYYDNSIKDDDQSFILEISIYDSGSGLVKNFLGENWKRNMSISEEVDIVKKCLTKGESSIQTKTRNKGLGLDEVVSLLSLQHGFLKIISGKTILYRDLIEHPKNEITNSDEIVLFDWKNMSSEIFTKQKQTEGTLITLAMPLN